EIFLLLIGQHTVAAGQHEDGVIVVECACVDAAAFIASGPRDLSFGDELRVRCDDRNVRAGLAADLLFSRERVRDRVVMETALRISYSQQLLLAGPRIGLTTASAAATTLPSLLTTTLPSARSLSLSGRLGRRLSARNESGCCEHE